MLVAVRAGRPLARGPGRRSGLLPDAVPRRAVDRTPAGPDRLPPPGGAAGARAAALRARRARARGHPSLRPAPSRARRDSPRARVRVGTAATRPVVEGRSRLWRRGGRRTARPAVGGLGLDRHGTLVRTGRALLRRAVRLPRAAGGKRGRGARLPGVADATPGCRRADRDPTRARPRRPPGSRRARPVPARARREPPRLRDALAARPRPRLDPRPRAPHADRVPRARRLSRASGSTPG